MIDDSDIGKDDSFVTTFKRNVFGIWDVDVTLLKLLNHSLENMATIEENEWFYYRDFNFYFTEVVPASSWLRNNVQY